MRVSQQGSNPEVQNTQAQSAQAKKTERAAKADSPKGSERADRTAEKGGAEANISAKARDFVKAKSVASETSDVREEKIAELKRRIAAGSYKVDADAIADRMVDDHLKTGIG